jgi:dihydroorotase
VKYLIKKAKVIDLNSKYHGKLVDIAIVNGVIEEIKSSISTQGNFKITQSADLHVSPSWIDIGTQIGEPGLEHRETIESIAKAAKAGGYGAIAAFPNTSPSIQTKSSVKYIIDKANENKLKLLPIASLSENNDGKEITEMYDLHTSGAVAFSDGLKSIAHAGLLSKALEYVKPFDGLIIHYPNEKTISPEAQMHEGGVSTLLGMRGNPYIAELITLKRDLDLLNYTESKLCIYGISAGESVKLIKDAKKANHRLYATVCYLNLIKTDQDLSDFDSNYKVIPPLRRKNDLTELIKGLKEDTIDAIVSNHYPIEEEGKNLEFAYAKFGASGIETCFAALNTYANSLDLDTLIYKLSIGPRIVLNRPQSIIASGNKADMTIFDPSQSWTFHKTQSVSKNNPFLGETLKGSVIDVIN